MTLAQLVPWSFNNLIIQSQQSSNTIQTIITYKHSFIVSNTLLYELSKINLFSLMFPIPVTDTYSVAQALASPDRNQQGSCHNRERSTNPCGDLCERHQLHPTRGRENGNVARAA